MLLMRWLHHVSCNAQTPLFRFVVLCCKLFYNKSKQWSWSMDDGEVVWQVALALIVVVLIEPSASQTRSATHVFHQQQQSLEKLFGLNNYEALKQLLNLLHPGHFSCQTLTMLWEQWGYDFSLGLDFGVTQIVCVFVYRLLPFASCNLLPFSLASLAYTLFLFTSVLLSPW